MKLGIISDTHGNLGAVSRAAAVFEREGVNVIFHCGDIGSFDVLSELAALEIPVHAVLGNVDHYSSDLKYFPTNLGVQLYGRFAAVEVAGILIALLHSDDTRRFQQTISSGEYDLVLSGHSHAVHDYMKGKTRCVNPGTAGRGSPGTCAVLDLERGCLTVYEV